MRILVSFIFCFAVAISFAKDPIHKVFGEYTDVILKASSIKVYRIEPYPIVATEQEPRVQYIYDYGVTRIYNYKKSDGRLDSLNMNLLDTTQFLYDNRRTCPFVGKYALEFTKGKRTITLVFSEKPCYKMIVFCPDTDIDKLHIDIADNNKIYSALLPLASDKM